MLGNTQEWFVVEIASVVKWHLTQLYFSKKMERICPVMGDTLLFMRFILQSEWTRKFILVKVERGLSSIFFLGLNIIIFPVQDIQYGILST